MTEVHHGLEGVVAFEAEIAEPDKEGSALRYRGVDIEDLVGNVSFGNVWGLLVDGKFTPGLRPAEPPPPRAGDREALPGTGACGNVWGLLVDGKFNPGLPPAEPFPLPVHSGDIRVDVQSAVAMLAPAWGLQQLVAIAAGRSRDDRAR